MTRPDDDFKALRGNCHPDCKECSRLSDRFMTLYFAADTARVTINDIMDKGEFANCAAKELSGIRSDLYEGMLGRKPVDN